jgi:3-phenylpropionate/trans-cinnamate dioxygenase ferredoxin reductase subunit
MRKAHRVVVNGAEFVAGHGDILLDAALMNGVQIPYDCRSGHCGSCSVQIVAGRLFGSADARQARACQCRVISDVEVAVDEVPDVTKASGRVAEVRLLAPDVAVVSVSTQAPVEYLPGQYFQVQFRGFNARCFSPTVAMDRPSSCIDFHIRRVPGGHVSSALGSDIKAGHRVKLKGPFGAAFHRYGLSKRLVLVCGGTGFAPIWAIADAAIRENPRREIVLVAGVTSIESLYMIPALWRLADYANTTIVPVLQRAQTTPFPTGHPTDYMPRLYPDDVVFLAGPPPLVAAGAEIAEAAGAQWYADPFQANDNRDTRLLTRAANWISRIGSPSIVPANDATSRTQQQPRSAAPMRGA